MAKSYYDELHDRNHSILTTKSGTRYERLAAVVFAALEKQSVVIHDLKLAGDSGVKHQIDVTIERDGIKKRILLECKDFDVSGDPVGLGIVRDFFGVVADVHPDEAWIITCNRFTADAQLYAKSKGIKLATLRAFEDADWQNRVRKIFVDFNFVGISLGELNIAFVNKEDFGRFFNDVGKEYPNGLTLQVDHTEVYDGISTRSIREIACEPTTSDDGGSSSVRTEKTPQGWIAAASGQTRYEISEYRVTVNREPSRWQLELSAVEEAVVLLLSGDEGLDFVVWDTVLEGFTIDHDGKVQLAPDVVQKRLIQKAIPIAPGAAFPHPDAIG